MKQTAKKSLGASRPFALLLLVTATMVLRHTGAVSSSSWLCSAKLEVCGDDAECNECINFAVPDSTPDPFAECLQNRLQNQADGRSTDSCYSGVAATPCCYASLSPNDCMGNSAFVDYWSCLIGDFNDAGEECTAVTCSDGSTFKLLVDDDAVVANDDMEEAPGATASSTGECQAEFNVCFADEECGDCILGNVDQVLECAVDVDTDATDHCSSFLASVCCQDAVSAYDCLGNSAFAEYSVCTASLIYGIECSLTCSDVEAIVDDVDGDDDDPDGDDDDSDGAGSVNTSSESIDGCLAYTSECLDDEVCTECIMAAGTSEYFECTRNYDMADSTDFCATVSGAPCCINEASDANCLENEVFVDYYLCIMNNLDALGDIFGADFDLDAYFGSGELEECTAITCSDGSSGATSVDGSGGVGIPSPSVLTRGLAFCSVAILASSR